MHRSPVVEHLLTQRRALDALNALALLEEYKAARTLTELALEYCRREKLPERCGPPITLRALFTRYQGSLSAEQTRYRAGHRCVANFFCARFGDDRPADSIRREEVEAALAGYASAASYNSVACRVRAVFRWGLREKLLAETTAAQIELRRVEWREPVFFRPEKVERIFRAAEAWAAAAPPPERAWAPAALRLLALGFFAGVRTAEIARARVEDLDLEGPVLRIPRPKGYTRGMRPRLVELEPNAVAWLRRHAPGPGESGPLVPELWRFTGWKKRVLAPLGLSWGNDEAHNVMRHTYATMHVGAFRDSAATALNLGHGRASDMLDKHYRGLVPKAVALPYWRIEPAVAP